MKQKIMLLTLLSLIVIISGCMTIEHHEEYSRGEIILTDEEKNEECILKKTSPDGPTYYSAYGCYWEEHTPLEFLQELKNANNQPVIILDPNPDWIKKEHIEELMSYIDSIEPASVVVSALSSYAPVDKISTVGNEAQFLIEGYRKGKYPPSLCSEHYFKSNSTQIKEWWKEYQENETIEEETAINLLKSQYPEYNGYYKELVSLKTIRTKKSQDGWHIAFVDEGSGVPIIKAECFFISNNREIKNTGTFRPKGSEISLHDLDAESCSVS